MELQVAAVIDREPGTLARFLVALRRCGFEFADYRFDDESEENSAPRVELRLRGSESAAAADDALRKLPGVVDLQVREYAAPGPDPARLQDPEELAGWLTGLDRVSSLEAAGLVNKRLAELADSTLAPNQRFALLERYGASAMALGSALENRFADWKLPLDPSVQVRVEAGLGLYRALAGAYEQILVAAVSSRQHNGQSAEAAQAARRALEFAFRYFRLTSLSYGCVPDRFWNAVHDVYARARALDIHEDGPVRHVYLKLLLGGLSEPAHFSGSAMHVLFDDAFRRWAAEAQLSERPPKGGRDGLFGLVRTLANIRFEYDMVIAKDDFVWVHSRYTSSAQPAAMIALDILRIEDGKISIAERELRRAQQALREALARDAPDAELERLMAELQTRSEEHTSELQSH